MKAEDEEWEVMRIASCEVEKRKSGRWLESSQTDEKREARPNRGVEPQMENMGATRSR